MKHMLITTFAFSLAFPVYAMEEPTLKQKTDLARSEIADIQALIDEKLKEEGLSKETKLEIMKGKTQDEEDDGFVIVEKPLSVQEPLLTRCNNLKVVLKAHLKKISERLNNNISQLFDFDETHSISDKGIFVFLLEKELTCRKQECLSDLKRIKDVEDILAREEKGTIKIDTNVTKKLEQWYTELYVNCQKPINQEIDALLLGDTPISHNKLKELIVQRTSK
jgi:hypothetical protein